MLEFKDVILGLGSLAGFVSLLVLIYDRWQRHNPKFTVTFDRSGVLADPVLQATNPGEYQVILRFSPASVPGHFNILTGSRVRDYVLMAIASRDLCVPLDPGETKQLGLVKPASFLDAHEASTLEVRVKWRFLHRRPYLWRSERIAFSKRDFLRALDEGEPQ